jgi:CelD/BcsL family acetyltransferase involved in cellulose biosynthesis
MRCTFIKASELSPDLKAVWSDFQGAAPLLASPALRPELFQAVGRHYPAAEIAVLEDGNSVVAFLPFSRHPFFHSIANPIPICDYQDFLRGPGCDIPLRDLLRATGLKTWIFNHLLVPPRPSEEVELLSVCPSKRIQIGGSYADYIASMKANGKSMKKNSTNLRLLGRDHGDVVFAENCRAEGDLRTLLEWKAQRFHAGKPVDRWIVRALGEIFAATAPGFAGVLATLRVGGKLVAAHFGIRSGSTLYYWFPAFNPEFSKYTPGWLLVDFLLQTAGNLGCDTIDLGPGGEPYKDYFSNVQVPVVGGHLELPGVINSARRSYRALWNGLRADRTAYSILRPVRHILRRF